MAVTSPKKTEHTRVSFCLLYFFFEWKTGIKEFSRFHNTPLRKHW